MRFSQWTSIFLILTIFREYHTEKTSEIPLPTTEVIPISSNDTSKKIIFYQKKIFCFFSNSRFKIFILQN